MDANYKLRCRHCGSEVAMSYRVYNKSASKSSTRHLETEIPIRCPHCLRRLNQSEEIFRSQIVKFPIAG